MIRKKKITLTSTPAPVMSEATCSNCVETKPKIAPLDIRFQNEDMNKLVEKVNEIIKTCQ